MNHAQTGKQNAVLVNTKPVKLFNKLKANRSLEYGMINNIGGIK